MPICSKCNEYVESYANRRHCRSCYNAYMRDYNLARYHRIRAAAIEKLGGKCIDCGSSENLEFDHVDPETKERNISALLSYSKQKLEIELKKCVLRCSTCHSSRTKAQREVSHGGGKTGKRGCYCTLCKPKKTEYNKEYRKRKRLAE